MDGLAACKVTPGMKASDSCRKWREPALAWRVRDLFERSTCVGADLTQDVHRPRYCVLGCVWIRDGQA
jgi:hypothetical protein